MTSFSQEILARFEVRKTKAQKSAFIARFTELFPEARVEETNGSRNIVVGDVGTAKVIFTAHYDTPAALPVPNLLFPKNLLLTLLYGVVLAVPVFFVGAAVSAATTALFHSFWVSYFASLAVLFGLLALMLVGPANKHNANDNTSGVAVVCELLARMNPAQREKVAFVLFDNEEKGLLGSAAFYKAHKAAMADKPLVNFDCVADGDNLLLFPNKKAAPSLDALLAEAFVGSGTKTVEVARRGYYPSDQKHFPCGVGAAAFRNGPLGLYISRIHTKRDTAFDADNIRIFAEGALRLCDRL